MPHLLCVAGGAVHIIWYKQIIHITVISVQGGNMEQNTVYTTIFSDYPDVVNIPQLCEMLGGIGVKAAYKLVNSGKIKCFHIGNSYKIPKLYVLKYLGVIE